MDNIKLRLSLSVPGAQMLSRQECLKNPKDSYDIDKMSVRYTTGEGRRRKVRTDILVIKTRKSRQARHNINICNEAYDYMISDDTPPAPKYSRIVKSKKGAPVSIWSTMSVSERLKVHLDLIAKDFNATDYTYEVLDD